MKLLLQSCNYNYPDFSLVDAIKNDTLDFRFRSFSASARLFQIKAKNSSIMVHLHESKLCFTGVNYQSCSGYFLDDNLFHRVQIAKNKVLLDGVKQDTKLEFGSTSLDISQQEVCMSHLVINGHSPTQLNRSCKLQDKNSRMTFITVSALDFIARCVSGETF